MLTRFSVKNFRGFKDEISIDLSNCGNYHFNEFAVRDGIIKNGIIYGPNGAGKTNFGLAIFDIANHLSQKLKKLDYYQNFIYAGCINCLVEFDYVFKFGKDTIDYSYSKDRNGILRTECLSVNSKNIFDRSKDGFTLNTDEFPIGEEKKKQLSENANNISIVNFLLMSYPLSKDSYLIRLHEFVDSMLWFRSLKQNEFIGLESSPALMEEFIISNKLTEDFANFLREVSGQSFKFVVNSEKDKLLMCRIGSTITLFDLICSTGTQSLILLYFWSKKISNASFVFIDEFDAFYHYQLSVKVCRMLFHLNCQLFLSSHNTRLMNNDLLRPDCNFIIDKGKIRQIRECTEKELREAHNIEKIYKSGAFNVE